MKKINSESKPVHLATFLNKTKFPIAKKLWKDSYIRQDLHAATLPYDAHCRMQVAKTDVSKVTFISLNLVKFPLLFNILLPTQHMHSIQI